MPGRRLSLWRLRFSLRALLVAVALTAILIPLGQRAYRSYVHSRDAKAYALLQSTKTWGPPSDQSFAIDHGRGVPNDYIILVRSGNTFGCFIPRNQYKQGESAEYDWFYRTDGLGTFDPADPHVKSGHDFTGVYVFGSGDTLRIKFGPFNIPWSGNGTDWGFVYYEYNPDPPDRSGPSVLRICSTDSKSVLLIDAREPHWLYKSHSDDPGLRGNEDANVKTTSVPR